MQGYQQKMRRIDDIELKLSILPWIYFFLAFFIDWAKKETGL